jgi:hypothetical protein
MKNEAYRYACCSNRKTENDHGDRHNVYVTGQYLGTDLAMSKLRGLKEKRMLTQKRWQKNI